MRLSLVKELECANNRFVVQIKNYYYPTKVTCRTTRYRVHQKEKKIHPVECTHDTAKWIVQFWPTRPEPSIIMKRVER
jgi:hypothetical protein